MVGALPMIGRPRGVRKAIAEKQAADDADERGSERREI
jgi:hypothetical protein